MSRVTLAFLDRLEAAEAILAATASLAALDGSRQIDVLVVRHPPEAEIIVTEELLSEKQRALIGAREHERAAALHGLFDRWVVGLPDHSIGTDWEEAEGDASNLIVERGRASDIIVLERPSKLSDEIGRRATMAALFQTGRPLLMVPPDRSDNFIETVAVAWKDDDRAAGAFLGAAPYLSHAKRIVVLGVEAGARLPTIVTDHGLSAESLSLANNSRSDGEMILAAAGEAGASLLVMGAYGHSRLREFILGGATDYVLAHADIPVLMRH